MTFAQMNMNQSLLDAITKGGYTEPTPIQAEAIPHILKGKDMLGSAQTGTGKTAAFALPIIHHLETSVRTNHSKMPRALILAPTRELALQIMESFHAYSRYSKIKTASIYGGVPKRKQIQKLKRGVDVVVATPGRLLDLMNMKIIKLDEIEYYVLDEADRMLDMGFIPDVKKITSQITRQHQTMLFSATLPESILKLSKSLLDNPVRIEVAKDNEPLETIKQSIYFVKKGDKAALLSDVLYEESLTNALVFTRTKQGANRLTKILTESGIQADAIHGNKTQGQRQRSLNDFKQGRTKVLVATDVASRGIDIDALSHVINYDLPETPETYLHRIGRTARAGKLGSSLSFCSPEETHLLKAVQKHIEMTIPVESDHRFKIPKPEPKAKQSGYKKAQASSKGKQGSRRKGKANNGNQPFKYKSKTNKSFKKQKRAYR